MVTLFRIGPGGPSPLGPLERRIMDALWTSETNCTVGDVLHALGSDAPSYSAVKAVLANLVRKRAVKKTEAGRAKTYAAVLSRDAFEGRVVHDVLSPLYRAHRDPLLAHFADALLDDGAVAEFEALIARRREERAR